MADVAQNEAAKQAAAEAKYAAEQAERKAVADKDTATQRSKTQQKNRSAVIALFRFLTDGRQLRVERKGRHWHVDLRDGGWTLHHEGEDLCTVVREMVPWSGDRL